MERKQLENPDLRAQHILELQQSLSESRATVSLLQTQLAERRTCEHSGMQAYYDLRSAEYEEQNAQALHVEQLLKAAIINLPRGSR